MRKTSSTNYHNEKNITSGCPITSTMQVIGGRWKLIIIWQLRERSLRYGELRRATQGISEKMLTQQLKALIKDGWVSKKDYQEIPPRTEYRLTQLGSSFVPILTQIYDWGLENGISEMP